LAGGGIGDKIQVLSYASDKNRWFTRFIIDLTYFMIIKMAFLNIIFGVIIDTFACKKKNYGWIK
jgi:hypothetical protein